MTEPNVQEDISKIGHHMLDEIAYWGPMQGHYKILDSSRHLLANQTRELSTRILLSIQTGSPVLKKDLFIEKINSRSCDSHIVD
jgi:hypothetical protein